MDQLFQIRTLTTAVNALRAPGMRIFQRHFADKIHLGPSDLLQFDVISGSEGVLPAITIHAPATVGTKTDRKTITMAAPRIAEKRLIHTSEMNALRAYGQQIEVELIKNRINRELTDMRNVSDRTLEFWAAYAIRGKIYDADLATVLLDYQFKVTHTPTLTGNDLWTSTHADSNPIADIRAWKRLIEDDSNHAVTRWTAWVGSNVMDALPVHAKVIELLKNQAGLQLAETGRIARLAEVDMFEYNGSFVDSGGTRRYFVPPNAFILVGEGDDVFDCPYAPIVDSQAPGGVGNVNPDGSGSLFYAKSWIVEDPDGRWIKVETRPLPAVQRPDAIVVATPI
jgi:hypothetical protein